MYFASQGNPTFTFSFGFYLEYNFDVETSSTRSPFKLVNT